MTGEYAFSPNPQIPLKDAAHMIKFHLDYLRFLKFVIKANFASIPYLVHVWGYKYWFVFDGSIAQNRDDIPSRKDLP